MKRSVHKKTTSGATDKEIRSASPGETEAVGESLGARLRPGDVVCLEGPLGSGKTCFVRGIARGMRLNADDVSSPTFVIAHEYARDSSGPALVHVDAYRLSGPDDLETIGWQELLGSNVVLAIEWPSRIESALPGDRIDVVLHHAGPETRRIVVHAPPSMSDRLTGLIAGESAPTRSHVCRTCGKAVSDQDPSFPFCSNRCRMADLGTWFNGGYRMSRPMQADEELSE